jgi:hypothetical protein
VSSLVFPAIAFIVTTELRISGVGRWAVGTQGTSSAHHGLQRDVRIVGIETSTGHHGFWRKDQIVEGEGTIATRESFGWMNHERQSTNLSGE